MMYNAEDFLPLSAEEKSSAETLRPSRTYWADVWSRLKEDRLAIFGLAVIVAVILFAVFAPILSR